MRTPGQLRVESRKSGRVWVAKIPTASGRQTRKVLGKAWVKDSGKRTARGAVIWRAANGPKPDHTFLTPREAHEQLRQLVATSGAKPQRPASRHTFEEATRDWLTYVEVEKGLAQTTLNRYRSLVTVHLLDAFGPRTPVHRLTASRIESYFADLAHGRRLSKSGRKLSHDTRRQLFVALNGILRRAQRKGWIPHNPMADVERLKAPPASGEFRVLTAVQVEAVARAAAADWEPLQPGARQRTRVTIAHAHRLTCQRLWAATHWAACIRIAAYTGLRMGELRALRWEQVDWAASVVHVQRNAPASLPSKGFADSGGKAPKSGRVGSVPLIPQAAATLEALTRRRLDPDAVDSAAAYVGVRDFVFPAFDGGMADIEPARAAFYRALHATGLGYLRETKPPIVFHDLRHTFGTLAVRAFPLSDVQRWMRHAQISTTMRYVHYVPQHDAARKLGEVFAVELGPVAVSFDVAA